MISGYGKAACITAFLSMSLTAFSQNYYVVVGALAVEKDASENKDGLPIHITDTINGQGLNKGILHFYIVQSSSKESALAKTQELKMQMGSDGKGSVASDTMEFLSADDNILIARNTSSSSSSSDASASSGMPLKPKGKLFKFTVQAPEGEVLANVHHIDYREKRDIAAYTSGEQVNLFSSGKRSEPMTVVCGVFGYKEIAKYIDYANPTSFDKEAYVDEEGTWVIPYKLERLEKGDVSPMYNVAYYKDAVAMLPQAKADLDQLVNMMTSNPYYEIRVHAYCNGRQKRKILASSSGREYFSTKDANEIYGSAKELTTLRAEAVRNYLADHGIEKERVQIYSWGGSDMLVPQDNPNAKLNDRVEIEIIRD